MKVRALYMVFAMIIGIPGLAMARSNGTPNWGALSQPHKTQFHGECCYNDPVAHGRQPGNQPGTVTSSSICNLAGEWKENPYSRAWGQKRLTEQHKSGPTLIQYGVKEFGIRGELHEIVDYDASHHSVEIYTFTNPDVFHYATGTVSPDCRQITLTSHEDDFALPRKIHWNYVRR